MEWPCRWCAAVMRSPRRRLQDSRSPCAAPVGPFNTICHSHATAPCSPQFTSLAAGQPDTGRAGPARPGPPVVVGRPAHAPSRPADGGDDAGFRADPGGGTDACPAPAAGQPGHGCATATRTDRGATQARHSNSAAADHGAGQDPRHRAPGCNQEAPCNAQRGNGSPAAPPIARVPGIAPTHAST